ncbi:D-alanine--D-alanine ligase family protein [Stackebrandtia soli]|uniref:D-alanine--D-alanine ligase family protein n=1 Tax=Stackebrandtia soli TaxID=1892856 RepID=UPI0039E88332
MTVSAEPIDVLILTGGQGAEHDVSLASAASVTAHLDPARYRQTAVTLGRDGRWYDDTGDAFLHQVEDVVRLMRRADVVFPLIHGRTGEDGTLAALLDLSGTPYVGSGVRAGAVAMDKHLTKLLAVDAGISVAPGVLVDSDREGARLPDGHGLRPPLFVKPNREGSSYGVTRVSAWHELAEAIDVAARFDRHVLVEEQIRGREVDIAVFTTHDGERRISPPLEILVGSAEFFDTAEKYDGGATFVVPAPLPVGAAARLREHADRLYRLLGCAGVARFDFFLAGEELVLNEVNTAPGLTAASQVPRMFAADGLPYSALLDALIDAAMPWPTSSTPVLTSADVRPYPMVPIRGTR